MDKPDAIDQLEWLAFSRGTRAFVEYLKQDLPWLDIEGIFTRYATPANNENGFFERDYDEWRSRSYVKQAEKDIRK